MDDNKALSVEIHLRLLDCQVCGSEIPSGKETYFKTLRLCNECCDILKSNYKFPVKKQYE